MTLSPIERRYIRRDNPPPFRVTPRALAILDALRRHSLLTSHQIAKLDGGSPQKVVRLLQLMFDHKLVDRPGATQFSPLSPFFDHRPMVYALSRKGASVLAGAGVDVNTRLDRTTRNKRAVLIEHSIATAETMFAFQAACAQHGGVRLSDHHDLLPILSPAARDRRKPFAVRVTVHPADFPSLRRLLKDEIEIGVENDRVLALALPDNTGWSFGLELDRGTERIIPRSLKGTSFLKKQLAITAAWQSGLFVQQWGPAFKAFRILTVVTTGEARIRTMLEAQNRIGSAPAGLFLYTTAARMAAQGPLASIWMTAKAENVSLLDRE
ncbi:MAG: replication-relaxation family protein [Hyphomicrobiaceae bacterium]